MESLLKEAVGTPAVLSQGTSAASPLIEGKFFDASAHLAECLISQFPWKGVVLPAGGVDGPGAGSQHHQPLLVSLRGVTQPPPPAPAPERK